MSYLSLSVKERFLNHGFGTPEEGVLQFPMGTCTRKLITRIKNTSGNYLLTRVMLENFAFSNFFDPNNVGKFCFLNVFSIADLNLSADNQNRKIFEFLGSAFIQKYRQLNKTP